MLENEAVKNAAPRTYSTRGSGAATSRPSQNTSKHEAVVDRLMKCGERYKERITSTREKTHEKDCAFKPQLQARTPKSAFLSARSHGYLQPSTKTPVVLPEAEECTFKPQLNKKSEDLVNLIWQDRRELPIHERLFEEALIRQEERRAEEAFPDEEHTFTPLINPQP